MFFSLRKKWSFSLRNLRIWSHLLKKSLIKNFLFCAVSLECLTADFSWLLSQMSRFGFWVVGWVLAIKSKHFKDFLDISQFRTIFKAHFKSQKQFLTTESPSKMMKNAFYFTLKALFVLKIFDFSVL